MENFSSYVNMNISQENEEASITPPTNTVYHSTIRTKKVRFLGLITEVFRERRGASHNYSYAHNYSYRGDQVFLTTYSTGMVNIFLSLETQTICLLTLDECIFSQLIFV